MQILAFEERSRWIELGRGPQGELVAGASEVWLDGPVDWRAPDTDERSRDTLSVDTSHWDKAKID